MEDPGIKRNICVLPRKNREISHPMKIKLALTEENLDFLLQQEYSLSQMCYKADQLTLEVLDGSEDRRTSNDIEKIVEIKNDIQDDKMEVEEDTGYDEYVTDQNKADDIELISTKPITEFVNGDVGKGGSISSQNLYEGVYNFELTSKERFNNVTKNLIDHRFKKRGKNVSVGALSIKELDDGNNVGKNSVVFKTLNLINISRALKTHKALHTNCNIHDILQVKNSLHPFSCLKSFGNEICRRKMKEITLPFSISTSMYQNLIHLIQTLLLKDEPPKNIDSIQSPVLETGLALIPASPQNTLVSNFNASDIKLDEIFTVFNRPTVIKNKIIELDQLETCTTSVNCTQSVAPAKSNLKRKIPVQLNNKKNKVKKSGLKFSNVTTIYFDRSQGFSSVPSKGGSSLGMSHKHFHMNTIPLDEYEFKKIQRGVSKRKTNHIFYRKTEKPKSVQALSLSQRIELLESAKVQIEVKEEDDCAYIRSSRASPGCDCKDYCDPDVCDCNLAGIECQVDRPNFPCGCSKENCRNSMGRNEYNHSKVRLHFSKTIKKIKSENKGRVSKRKQALPSKVFNNNSNNETDIDMVAV